VPPVESPGRPPPTGTGLKRPAGIADDYNAGSTHPYRLGDCILGKLNLRDGKPRKNVKSCSKHPRAGRDVEVTRRRVVVLCGRCGCLLQEIRGPFRTVAAT
jgi:hypothetical protein